MRIIRLNGSNAIYTCNVYLVMGTWSTIDDVNTLVDTGTDGGVIEALGRIYTGVGKTKVQKVILTHDHFDHSGGVPALMEKYGPKIYAFSDYKEWYRPLEDGLIIKMGDRYFQVVHTPGHSSDSICLYCEEERVLFSGDTSVRITTAGDEYEENFVFALEKLAALDIETIYPGHGDPITGNAGDVIRCTLEKVKNSPIKKSLPGGGLMNNEYSAGCGQPMRGG